MEAVARRFGGTWKSGDDSADAYVRVAGPRIPVAIVRLKPRDGKIRLRFDKVVTRVVGDLQSAAGGIVPAGTTVLVTITAPIRLASKTTQVMEEEIRKLVGRGSWRQDTEQMINGNRVSMQLLKPISDRAPKLIGFVHNPDTDAGLLFDITEDLLRVRVGQGESKWLVLIGDGEKSQLQAYRYLCSELKMDKEFCKVVVVWGDEVSELST